MTGTDGEVPSRRRWISLAATCTAAGLVWLAFADFGVAALAPGVGVLIAGRGLMGIGAALILPATLALIPVQFSGPHSSPPSGSGRRSPGVARRWHPPSAG